jgi:hypothetical protein
MKTILFLSRDVKTLTAHIDLLPTLVDLLGLEKPSGRPLDGISLRAALESRQESLPERTLFVHVQRAFLPPKWKESATNQTVRYVLGGAENPMTLSSHDWLMPGVEQAAWHQNQIRSGALINGAWAVNVKQAGTYEITLYRWPPYLNQAMNTTEARLSVGDVDERTPVNTNAARATFRVKLKPGPAMLQTWLTRPDGKQHGAYYTRVRLDSGE